jgi:L-threonylcarbamoyladenylate synthase
MPQTLHLSASDPDDLARAATLLREGRLVAFATETVYGLGANALNPTAVANIFAAKQRPAWDPLIVHLASADQLSTITSIPPDLADRIATLAAAFWPGPLTLLLPRNAEIPDAVTAGRELVGVRVPAHPAAHALLAAAGLPIAAPSANLFGHTSPTTAAHVLADLNGAIDAVLDAGPTTVGLESTVLDPTQTPMVLYRPGAITAAQITSATGIEVTTYQPTESATPPQSLPSPGVGIRHYAPRATLILTEPTPEALNAALELFSFTSNTNSVISTGAKRLHRLAQRRDPCILPDQAMNDSNAQSNRPGATAGVLLPTNWHLNHPALIQPWADWNSQEALAATLFAGLRTLDDQGVDVILCPLPPPGGLADAIRDRLQKAARTT